MTHDEMVVQLGRTTSPPDTARIPAWVLSSCRTEVWLYAHLALLAGDHDTVAMSVPRLAERVGVSQRTVQKAIGALREAGAIEVRPQVGPQGAMGPNVYVLAAAPPGTVA